MDFSNLLNSLQNTLGDTAPQLLGALAILFVGWLAAVIARAAVRKALGAAGLNNRISGSTETTMDLESGIAKGVFWVIMALVLVGFFNALDLEMAFGLTLGAIAVAAALSFGLGGRDAAGKQTDYWLEKLRS